MKQYTLTIQNIRKETKDTITLCFKQPGLRKINYQAGQYITLMVKINGRKYARPYSFSSAPSVDSFLEVTVKRVSNGIVSNYINDKLKVGDIIEVLEPMGDFVYNTSKAIDDIYLWGVGSGITPLFSVAKEILNTKTGGNVHLIYGNKDQKSMIFQNQLSLLQQENLLTFKITNFYSQVDLTTEKSNFRKGRINEDFVNYLMSQNENAKNSIHYICGPNGLKNTVKNSLLNFDIPLSSILIEEFELVIDPKEFVGIEDSNVSINFQGVDTIVEVEKGKSILEAALDAGIELPYSCQTGSCNTCKGKLKAGGLRMIGLLKEREDLALDDYLLCCSHPLTEDVYIQI